MERLKLARVNLLYLVLAMLLVTAGSYMQSLDVRLGLIGTEILLVLLPAFLFVRFLGLPARRVFRLHPVSGPELALAASMTLLVYPTALLGNLLVVNVLEWLGLYREIGLPTASGVQDYVILLLIVAFGAGICEEVLFRGLLLRAYGRLGSGRAVWLTALLFGLFHFNPQNFAAPAILGLLFGYLVLWTGSLYPAMIAHITNNALAVTLGFAGNLSRAKAPPAPAVEAAASTGDVAMVFAAFAAFALACLIMALKLSRRLKRLAELRESGKALGIEASEAEDMPAEALGIREPWWTWLPLAAAALMYMALAALFLQQV